MPEQTFEVGPLRGHRGGSGPPALLLHGGAAVPDYLDRPIEPRRRDDDVTEDDLVERFALVWLQYFADPALALPPPSRVGAAASIGTNRSLAKHFERGTLAARLPTAELSVLFVHGERSVLPVRSSAGTAALLRDAELVVVPGVGHFPWVERPGSVRQAVEVFLAHH